MKFTDGFWLYKPEMKPLYAEEVFETWQGEGNTLGVFMPGHHIAGRNNTIDFGGLTAEFSSPAADVIKVKIMHHDGALDPNPVFEVNDKKDFPVTVEKGEEYINYISGGLRARINAKPSSWQVDFFGGDKFLTSSPRHAAVHITDTKKDETYMVDALSLSPGEYVYGLGERFTAFTKNGQVVDIWNEDGGTASELAYKNIPFYVTNKGYGVFVCDTGKVSYEVACEKVERVQFSIKGERLEYYVIYGPTVREILEKYTALTGRPALPPAWSFGLWLSTSFTTSYDEETVTSFIKGMEDRKIPTHVFHFDVFWMKPFHLCDFEWDGEVFPDPEGMLARYKARGLRICLWLNPYIAQRSKLFEEGKRKGYFIKNKDGSVWQWDKWQAGQAIVDFTNPEACEWYAGILEGLLDQGVDCFKTDFCERIPHENVTYYNGADPERMHNYLTYLYNKTVFDVLVKKRGMGEAVLFARSATAGGQQFPVHWGGDCTASYPSMAESLRAGLSLSLCGFGFWSHDISGFEMTAPADLYKRWSAFGLLSSHSRLHGSTSYRVPWLFDDEACDVVRFFSRLKCHMMPYLFQKAVEAHDHGWPMMRPMMMEFPADRGCDTLDMQYMMGDDLLVAPVFNEEGYVDYYLPEGKWTHLISGEVVNGGGWRSGTYDYFSLPLMVKPNSVLPVGANWEKPEYDYADGVLFELFEIEDGAEITTVIPTMKGDVAMTAVTTRCGNKITVKTTGQNNNWKIILRGIHEVKSANGQTQDSKLGLVVVAQGDEIVVEL